MRRESGFSLAALIFFMTASSILLAVAVPAYQMQDRRDREAELIFRGEEYARAIQKFQRKFAVYPPSLDALEETNGIRFLRRQYTDPVSGKAFRLISINADGSVSGSTVLQRQAARTNLPSGAQPFIQQPGLGGPAAGGAQTNTRSPQQQQPASGGGLNQNPPSGQTATAGIIGVGSDAEGEAVKVYNNSQKYGEWEFIAIISQPAQGTGNQPAGTNTNPNQPANPGANQNQNPNPFNPQSGATQNPNQPFGFGQPQQPAKRP